MADTTAPTSSQTISSVESSSKAFDDNILGNYTAPTYHIRFYAKPESNTSGNAQVNTATSSAQSVIIAESGVTTYNIKSLEFESNVSMGQTNRNVILTDMYMSISEPNGTSFLNAMYLAVTALGNQNWQKSVYFIDISFKGYNEDGSLNQNLCSNFPNGGIWTYQVNILNIDTEVSPSGSSYRINMQPVTHDALTEDIGSLKGTMKVTGKTLGQFLDNFADQLNEQAKKFSPTTVINGAKGVGQLYTYSFDCIPTPDGKDIRSFTFNSDDPTKHSPRNLDLTVSDHATVTGNFVPGNHVIDIITTAISATKEGPTYAINASGKDSSDRGTGGYRAAGIFRVYPEALTIGFDYASKNYIKTIVYHIKLYKSQATTIRTAEVVNAEKNGPEAIRDVRSYNGLRKRYDWLFTGLNTEVLEFNTKFNFKYNAIIPVDGGFDAGIPNVEHYAAYNPYNNKQTKTENDDAKIDATAVNNAFKTQLNSSNGAVLTGTNTSSTIVYAEDFVTATTQKNPFIISIQQGGAHVKEAAGMGMPGRFDRRRSIFAAIIQQSQTALAFNQISLRIKGDPYWLGVPDQSQPSTSQQQQALTGGSNTNGQLSSSFQGGALLPDYSAGDNYFVLRFKFPYTLKETGAPILIDDNIFSGIYSAVKILHSFDNGIYTQTIEGNRMPYVTSGTAVKVAEADQKSTKGGS